MTDSEVIPAEQLFVSAAQMVNANNYNDWTFSLFQHYLHGDILEVGCGVGSFTRRIVAHGGFQRFVSIDISADAVNYCRARIQHPDLEYRVAAASEANGEFDVVVCMNVLEHIEDDRQTLRHLLEVLKPHGILFLLVPAHQALYSRFDVDVGHYRRYDKRSMRKLFDGVSAGLRCHMEQFYFNSIGALGFGFVYKVLRKVPIEGTESEISMFDRLIVPILRRLEGKHTPFGISLISVITKE